MLPASWRKQAGIGPSSELRATITQKGSLILEAPAQGLRRAQALVRKYVHPDVSLADELIADRRREAAREARRR